MRGKRSSEILFLRAADVTSLRIATSTNVGYQSVYNAARSGQPRDY
jgi:hypothetical protein